MPIRLVDGANEYSGRLEIQYYGAWGTICSFNFNFNSANVACKSLGFVRAVSFTTSARSGSGEVWLSNVRCIGNETLLEQCSHRGFGNNFCSYRRDVGVDCIGMANICNSTGAVVYIVSTEIIYYYVLHAA